MQHEPSAAHAPVVLVATGDEWLARSIESILAPNGVSVIKALNGKQTLDLARLDRPDAILLESRLPDVDSLDLCRALRDDPSLAPHTPILLASVAPARRRDRLEALRAGAWDFCDILPDTEELVLRIQTYLKAKVATDQIREASLMDDLTGLYNLQGLMRRLQEAGSEALRYHRPLACLAIAPELSHQSGRPRFDSLERTERMGRIVTNACRASDSIARLPSNEFVVLATETAPPGAQRLAERVIGAAQIDANQVQSDIINLNIGYFAVWDFTSAAIQPVDMLVRATSALQLSRAGAGSHRIVGFDPQQTSLA